MRRAGGIFFGSVGALVALFLSTIAAQPIGAEASTSRVSSGTLIASAPGGIEFVALNATQLNHVQWSVQRAIAAANGGSKLGPHIKVSVELGGFINANDIVQDWVGTKSYVPKPVPAYLVKISGVDMASLGPKDTYAHHEATVVNAVDGHVIETVAWG